MNRLACWLALAWMIAAVAPDYRQSWASGPQNADSETNDVLRVADLHPTYGLIGSRRHSSFVAGETMNFAARFTGIKTKADGHCDCEYNWSLVDSAGKAVEGSSSKATIDFLCLGGDESTVYFAVPTLLSTTPGQYTIKLAVHDRQTKQSTEKELPVTVLDKSRFCILNAGLYSERLSYFSGGNATAGGRVDVTADYRVLKNRDNQSIGKASIALIDSNGDIIAESQTTEESAYTPKNGGEFFVSAALNFETPGQYRLHIMAKDVSTNRVETCDLPLVVRASPGWHDAESDSNTADSRIAAPKNATMRAKRELSLDAFPTAGWLGARRDATFVSAEQMYLSAVITGLAVDAKGFTHATLDETLLGPNFEVIATGKDKIDRRLLSTDKSLVLPNGFLAPDKTPGRYLVRFVIDDKIARKTTKKEVVLQVVDLDRFVIGHIIFTGDEAGCVPFGPNLTVGQPVYARCGVYLPKTSNGHDVEMELAFLDAKQKRVLGREAKRVANVRSAASGRYVVIVPTHTRRFTPNRPGEYILRVGLKDLVTQETTAKEMPFNVFPPPELPEPPKPSGDGSSREVSPKTRQ